MCSGYTPGSDSLNANFDNKSAEYPIRCGLIPIGNEILLRLVKASKYS